MGVHGLWKLLEPAGKPVPVETLENKVLAVDVSIWLHQFVKGFQDSTGSSLPNAHLMGLFTRICKLLFFKVKPVFVFDGGVPTLKRKTMAARQQQKSKAVVASEKLREKLLKNLLKQRAVSQVLDEIRAEQSGTTKKPDMFELPPSALSDADGSDNESVESVEECNHRFADLHSVDVTCDEFKTLPADVRHDILTELKETRKQSSWGRIHLMPEELGDFSNFQMKRLLNRRSVQVSLEEVEKEIGGRTLSLGDVEAMLAEEGVEITGRVGSRIASDDVTRYVYVSDPTRKITQANKSDDRSKDSENDTSEDKPLSDSEQKPSSSSDVKVESTQLPEIVEEVEFNDSSSDCESVKEELANYMSENSDLTQEQILTVIKQQHKNAVSKTYRVDEIDINAPSSSKQSHSFEYEIESEEDKCTDKLEQVSTKLDVKPVKVGSLEVNNMIICDADMPENIELSQEQILLIIKEQNKCLKADKMDLDGKQSSVKESSLLLPSVEEPVTLLSRDKSNAPNVNIVNNKTKRSSEVETSSVKNMSDSVRTKLSNLVKGDLYVDIKPDFSPAENARLKCSVDVGNNCDKLNIPCAKNVEIMQPEMMSASESDDDFIDVPSSPKKANTRDSLDNGDRKSYLKQDNGHEEVGLISSDSEGDFAIVEDKSTKLQEEQGKSVPSKNIEKEKSSLLQITIQTNADCKIDDDIFADIFLPQGKSDDQLSAQNAAGFSPVNKNHKNEVAEGVCDNATGITKEDKPLFNEGTSVEREESKSVIDGKSINEQKSGNGSSSSSSSSNKNNSAVYSVPEMGKSKYFPKSKNEFEDDKVLEKIIKGEENIGKEQESDSDNESSDIIPKALSQKYGNNTVSKKLASKDLKKLQTILETQEENILAEKGKEERTAATITEQMYMEAMELLNLFGIPYVVAPMEAEAQCAFLDSVQLTEGTITDDSDIWLFGGRKVYKNFFNQKKFVLEFRSDDIQYYFKLSRPHLVLLALLVGSDYTVGVQGVGPVTALEILAAFPPADATESDNKKLLAGMEKFREWLKFPPPTPLARKLKNVELQPGFPNSEVIKAYLNPEVNESRETFSWGTPDLDGLRDFASRKFGWSKGKSDQILLPVMKKLAEKNSQKTIESYFRIIRTLPANTEQMSKRVQRAVNRLDGNTDETEVIPATQRNRGRRGRSSAEATSRSTRGGRGRGRGRGILNAENESNVCQVPVIPGEELIPQREKDRLEALKRKMDAIEVFKNSKKSKKGKRKNMRLEKEPANLSESSDEDG